MRQLALINAQGKRWDLMSKTFFGANPDGLGIKTNNEYIVEGASFKLTKKAVAIDTVNLDLMVLGEDPYGDFTKFCEFLDVAPIYLEYSTMDPSSKQITYRRDVEINELPKGELDKWGVLNSALQLDKMTPWYIWIKNEIRNNKYNHWTKVYFNENEGSFGEVIEQTPFYVYPFGYSTVGYWDDVTGNVKNDSILMGLYDNTPMRVTIKADSRSGVIEKPGWEILNSEKERLYFMEFNININPGETLIVTSEWFNIDMYLIDRDGKKTDLKNKLTLESDSYCRLPKGNITFKPNSEHLTDIFNEWYGVNFLLEYKLEKVVV